MARIVTVKLLVDSENDEDIADFITSTLNPLKGSTDDLLFGSVFNSLLIDYRFSGPYQEIPPELEDAIVNGTYHEDDNWE